MHKSIPSHLNWSRYCFRNCPAQVHSRESFAALAESNKIAKIEESQYITQSLRQLTNMRILHPISQTQTILFLICKNVTFAAFSSVTSGTTRRKKIEVRKTHLQ